jgi:phosphoribosylformylglycinamidine synthase PurS subunit
VQRHEGDAEPASESQSQSQSQSQFLSDSAMRFRARVEVQLRPGISDPEGATIERALPALGFAGVAHVRAGRSFSFEVDAPDEGAARTTAAELADRLLANPVIEQSRLELEAL